MTALAISILAFLFSVAVLFWVLTDDWRCWRCNRYRRRGTDGWRRCDDCGTGWKIEDAS